MGWNELQFFTFILGVGGRSYMQGECLGWGFGEGSTGGASS